MSRILRVSAAVCVSLAVLPAAASPQLATPHPAPGDSPYTGVELAFTCARVASLRAHLKHLSDCKPEKECKLNYAGQTGLNPIDEVRKALFGDQFHDPRFLDFIVYIGRDDAVSGPVLSYGGRNDPYVFGARHAYAVVFSDTNDKFTASLTRVRPKSITPIEALFQQIGKLNLLSSGESAPPAHPDPEIKTIDLLRLGPIEASCPEPPIYLGRARFAVEPDTADRITVRRKETVTNWSLEREVADHSITATLKRSTNFGTTAITETLTIPGTQPLTDEAIARYAKVCEELPARVADPSDAKASADPDAATPLTIAKFPNVGEKGEAEKALDGSKSSKKTTTTAHEEKKEDKPEDKPQQHKKQKDVSPAQRVTTTTDTTTNTTATEETTSEPLTSQMPGQVTCTRQIAPADNSTTLRGVAGFFSNSESRWVTVSLAFGAIPRVRKTVTLGTTTTQVTNVSTPATGSTDATQNGTVTTTTQKLDEADKQTHFGAYIFGKVYLPWPGRPKLKAREQQRSKQPYTRALGLGLGTNVGFNELVIGLSYSHIIDGVGVVGGLDFVAAGGTFPESKRHYFVALDYTF